MEISTANIQVSTASPPKVSTVVPHVYTRRSAKDKGKAIMEEPATPKKVKKRTQVQLSMDEELARKMEEEERIRFNAEQEARALQEEEEERLNLEAARELQRQLDQRQEVPTQPTQSQGIDWNDPSVLRYHALKNKPPSPEPIQPTHEAEETASMPHDSPLHVVHSHGSAEGSMQQHDLTVLVNKLNDRIDGLEKDLQQTKKTYSTALTKLVLRVKKLEYKLKSGKARRKAKIVLSDDEEIAEDSSKQRRKISQIDEDSTISLVQDEGISWIPQEEEVHEKPSDETKVLVQEETPTEIIEERGSGEKG
ncbi:hypothetical protein Tco_0385687 [Tanacetum coccineum]